MTVIHEEHVTAAIDDNALDYQTIKKCKEQKKLLDDMEKDARARIEARLIEAGAEDAQIAGKTVITWRYISSHRLDQKKLKESYPEAHEACYVETQNRRFEIVGE